MPSDPLFGPSTSTPTMLEATSDHAWVAAMLQVEAALAAAECHLGLIPLAAAQAISARCEPGEYDIEQLGRDAVQSANPVVPLVTAVRQKVGKDAAPFVHLGATSQDILDTAMMVITRRALDLVLHDVDRAAAAAATLADRHRSTLMAARTLLQQASVTTFGLKVAGWLNAITEARAEVWRVRTTRLAIQFGGAAGSLAALSDNGLEVARTMAAELDLADPVLPWHTARSRVVEVANVLGLVAGVAGKVATDVVLMAQTEVGEVREAIAEGKGGSSAMPQKQNPVQSIEILAAVRGINAQVATLQQAMVQEHERAAGAWQAEWPALTECLRLTGGAAARLADVLGGIQVDPGRMRRNLDLTGGLVMAESVVVALARRVDGLTARTLVDRAVATAQSGGRSFAQVIKEDRQIAGYLDSVTLANALEPARYIGAAGQMIDRALAAYRRQRKGES
ncbi:MAG: 3-carboxy-cis,cis-muconate cycloisomerase [Candidatus Dormibacter sp.]